MDLVGRVLPKIRKYNLSFSVNSIPRRSNNNIMTALTRSLLGFRQGGMGFVCICIIRPIFHIKECYECY